MATTKRKLTQRQAAVKHGWRSGLEERVAEQLDSLGVAFTYEKLQLGYIQPESKHTYTPDFILENGIIVETKGRFELSDRKKHLLVKAQHPDLDIRFVFSNSRQRITKTSKTTYGMWCTQHGFIYADKFIPLEWTQGVMKND